jgi:hypothetical protein
MTVSVAVDLPRPPEAVRAYLRDPRRRPEWQSSLRRVDDVHGSGEVGTTWRDVTWPGLRPAMRVTEDTPTRWAETGSWRGWTADLALDLAPLGTPYPSGTRVLVTAGVRPPRWLGWLRRPMDALAARAIAADVRKAGSLIP